MNLSQFPNYTNNINTLIIWSTPEWLGYFIIVIIEQFCYNKTRTRGGLPMFIEIEMDTDTPIYIQLINGLIEAVANGTLQPGDSLPSVRSLAADLGINMHTVNKAYRELDTKGIVRIIPKSGAVVNKPSKDQASINRIKNILRPNIAEALAIGLSNKEIEQIITELTSTIKEEQQ